jgi:hypothetical protein
MESAMFEQIKTMLGTFLDVPAVHDLLDLMPIHHTWGYEWQEVNFDQPVILWGLVAVLPLMIFAWRKRQPALGHSRLPRRAFSMRGVFTIILMLFSSVTEGASTALLIVALALPQMMQVLPGDVVMVRDIHFAIDQSNGNMSEYIGTTAHQQDDSKNSQPPPGTCGEEKNWGYRKIDNSAYAACKIAQAFPDDRKSLATFDGHTQCCQPAVNSDWRFFNQRIRYVNQQLGDNTTNFEDENGVFNVMLGFIEQKSTSNSRVLVILTDGDGTLTDESIQRYVQRIKADKVTLICTGPGQDTTATDPPTDAIVKLCNQAGMIVDTSKEEGIQKIIEKIKSLPPSEVKLKSKSQPRPVHEAFLLAAALAWLLSRLAKWLLGRIR